MNKQLGISLCIIFFFIGIRKADAQFFAIRTLPDSQWVEVNQNTVFTIYTRVENMEFSGLYAVDSIGLYFNNIGLVRYDEIREIRFRAYSLRRNLLLGIYYASALNLGIYAYWSAHFSTSQYAYYGPLIYTFSSIIWIPAPLLANLILRKRRLYLAEVEIRSIHMK